MFITYDKIILIKDSDKMEEIIKILTLREEKISTMESSTGGFIANAITNIEGSSEVFSFGAVTYSNFYKIKLGVDEKIIKKYSVYSMEVAHEMSRAITNYTNSRYGIGITGKLNRTDRFNPTGKDNIVYLSIFDQKKNHYIDSILEVENITREENKKKILLELIVLLKKMLKEE